VFQQYDAAMAQTFAPRLQYATARFVLGETAPPQSTTTPSTTTSASTSISTLAPDDWGFAAGSLRLGRYRQGHRSGDAQATTEATQAAAMKERSTNGDYVSGGLLGASTVPSSGVEAVEQVCSEDFLSDHSYDAIYMSTHRSIFRFLLKFHQYYFTAGASHAMALQQ
jgi:hypothetical protein